MARVYYVSTVGEDTNDGLSETAPWQTMQKVNSTAFQPGDRILFRKGDTWTYPLTVSSSGTEGEPVVFSSYGAGSVMPVFDGQDAPSSPGTVSIGQGTAHVVVENVEITGRYKYGVYMHLTDSITIQNCKIHTILQPVGHCIAGNGLQKNTSILHNEIAYCFMEAVMINSENIEIAYNHMHHIGMIEEAGQVTCRNAKADVIQLNCWSPDYWVHDNILDRRGSCAPKGVFISSHCTEACMGNSNDNPCKPDDLSTFYSNGIFENNECIAGEGNGFGFTNAGYGDIVRNNTFVSYHDNETGLPLYGLRSEHGVLAYNNSWKGYKHILEIGKADSIYHFYNNVFDIYESSQKYSVVHNEDHDPSTVYFRNNIFLDRFVGRKLQAEQKIYLSNNISTVGFSSNGGYTLIDEGDNSVMPADTLKLKDWANNDANPLPESLLIDRGRGMGAQDGFGNHTPTYLGSSPNIGIDSSFIGVSPDVLVGPVVE